MAGYIGTQPVPQATQTRDTFTATAGQTSFATSGYTPTFLDVYLNGVHLQNGVDYTATNSSDVVLTTGAALGDVLEVVAFTTFELVEDLDVQLNTGTATTNQVLSWTGSDYDWVASVGGGLFKGENGEVGDAATGAGDIFRINQQTLNTSTTIDADENASATGPLAIATGVTLTVTAGGNLSIV
jgi:hypothetical protein